MTGMSLSSLDHDQSEVKAVIADMMRGLTRGVGCARREALLRNAGGPEEFLATRANFAASVAALSVTGYITGAGDRHTENFLLHRASGTLVPIDFGCAFYSWLLSKTA